MHGNEEISLTDLIDEYGTRKRAASKKYAEYKQEMVELESLRKYLQSKLESIGLRSAKSKNFGVSIVSKPTISVTNEHAVMDWLKDEPSIESDQYIGIKTTAVKQLALQRMKETGEIIDGTEYTINESVSVKGNKS